MKLLRLICLRRPHSLDLYFLDTVHLFLFSDKNKDINNLCADHICMPKYSVFMFCIDWLVMALLFANCWYLNNTKCPSFMPFICQPISSLRYKSLCWFITAQCLLRRGILLRKRPQGSENDILPISNRNLSLKNAQKAWLVFSNKKTIRKEIIALPIWVKNSLLSFMQANHCMFMWYCDTEQVNGYNGLTWLGDCRCVRGTTRFHSYTVKFLY